MSPEVLTTDALIERERRRLHSERAARERAPSLIAPITHPVRPSTLAAVGWWSVRVPATAGAWQDIWHSWAPAITHDAASVFLSAVADVTGAADVRLRITADGGVDVASGYWHVGNGLLQGQRINFLHQLPVWTTTNVRLALQARVASATFDLFAPYGGSIIQNDPAGASNATGLLGSI